MTTTSSVLGVVPGLMATSLVAHNIPKFSMKPSKDMGMKKISKLGMTNLVGIGLIGATASVINKI